MDHGFRIVGSDPSSPPTTSGRGCTNSTRGMSASTSRWQDPQAHNNLLAATAGLEASRKTKARPKTKNKAGSHSCTNRNIFDKPRQAKKEFPIQSGTAEFKFGRLRGFKHSPRRSFSMKDAIFMKSSCASWSFTKHVAAAASQTRFPSTQPKIHPWLNLLNFFAKSCVRVDLLCAQASSWSNYILINIIITIVIIIIVNDHHHYLHLLHGHHPSSGTNLIYGCYSATPAANKRHPVRNERPPESTKYFC